jgi:hypothetical protein
MATANPYDPKNRSISKTIYYSHQDNAAVDSSIASSPFPTAYSNTSTVAGSAETCTIDFSNAAISGSATQLATLDEVDNAASTTLVYNNGAGHGSTTAAMASHFASLITASGNGTWATATATANASVLTITNTVTFKARLTNHNGDTQTAPLSGGTVSGNHMVFTVVPSSSTQSSRDFADGLVEGGSSYTVQVLQGE